MLQPWASYEPCQRVQPEPMEPTELLVPQVLLVRLEPLAWTEPTEPPVLLVRRVQEATRGSKASRASRVRPQIHVKCEP